MMTPAPEEQIWALLQLSGISKAELPGSVSGQEEVLLRLISASLGNGANWSQIAMAILGRRDGKLAKKIAKRLAKRVQRDLLRGRDTSACA